MSTNGHNIVAPYIATVKVKVIVGIWRASSSTDEIKACLKVRDMLSITWSHES
jgi:hypothetical protein